MAPDPLSDRAPGIVGTSGGQALLRATEGATELTGLFICRREVEDTAGLRSLGPVEPAAERAREVGPAGQAMR